MARNVNDSEPRYRRPLKVAGVLLAGAAALTACGNTDNNQGDTITPSQTISSGSASPEAASSTAATNVDPSTVTNIDPSITGVTGDKEAIALLEKWSLIYTKDATDTSGFLDNPQILMEAAGLLGNEAQTKAIDAMANDLHITPKELAVNAQLMLDEIKRIKPFIKEVEAEEKSNDIFDGVPITAASQYQATRGYAYIIAKINNGIADGSIEYPDVPDNCDDLASMSSSLTTTYTLPSGGMATYSPLFPPLSTSLSVSSESVTCLNVNSTKEEYASAIKNIDEQNIKYAKENGFAKEAEALEILSEPVLGTNEKANERITELKL